MQRWNGSKAVIDMTNDDSDTISVVTERFERRLTDETSKLRVEMSTEFGRVRTDMATEFGKVRHEMATEFGRVRKEMADGFGSLRVEMIERNHDLLKWMLIFGVTQTAAIVGLIRLWR
jgi:hypothetical protein